MSNIHTLYLFSLEKERESEKEHIDKIIKKNIIKEE